MAEGFTPQDVHNSASAYPHREKRGLGPLGILQRFRRAVAIAARWKQQLPQIRIQRGF